MSAWQYMAAFQWNFNRHVCGLGAIQSDMPSGQLKIKDKSYSTNALPSDMPTSTVKLYQARLLLHCQCNRHACWLSATPCRELLSCCSCNRFAYWPVYLLPQAPLLFKYAYWLSAVARWMPADLLQLNPAYLLVLCFSLCHTCGYGVALSAVPAGVVPHY